MFTRLKSRWASVWDRRRQRALVLLYHRVTSLRSDPQWLCVASSLFAEHLQIVRQHYTPMRLEQLDRLGQQAALPRPGVVITFDDGYPDNLYEAKPLLERHDMPATVFVATAGLEGKREFWWDELEALVLEPAILPEALSITIGARTCSWCASGGESSAAPEHGPSKLWTVADTYDPTPRHRLYRELVGLLHGLDGAGREAKLDELASWAGMTRGVRASHRPMRPEEVVALAQGGLVEIGAHTVHHLVLSALPASSQAEEIETSKRTLEDIAGTSIQSFSYPFGTPHDYTSETVRLVKSAGFCRACSNFSGFVTARTPVFELPRVVVRNWNGAAFERQLENWFSNLKPGTVRHSS